jgi:hypothetical protein
MSDPPLIGLLHGHFELETKTKNEDTLDINSGIAIVIPVAAIRELLDRSDVARWRLEQKEKIDAGLFDPKSKTD